LLWSTAFPGSFGGVLGGETMDDALMIITGIHVYLMCEGGVVLDYTLKPAFKKIRGLDI